MQKRAPSFKIKKTKYFCSLTENAELYGVPKPSCIVVKSFFFTHKICTIRHHYVVSLSSGKHSISAK